MCQKKQTAIAVAFITFLFNGTYANANNHEKFESAFNGGRSCFNGPFSNFDTWREMISKKSKSMEHFDKVFNKEDHTKFSETLHCESIVYSSDGQNLIGFVIYPKNIKDNTPIIIYNRGGNSGYGSWNFGLLMRDLMPLASKGYLVVASNYRGKHNGRLNNDVVINEDEFGGRDVNDVVSLLDQVDDLKWVDKKSITMIGVSRGGMQTWLSAKQMPEVKNIIIISGATDLESELIFRPEMENVYKNTIPNYAIDGPSALNSRSVINFIQELNPKINVMIVHGKKDEKVSVRSAYKAIEILKKHGIKNHIMIFPERGHDLTSDKKYIYDRIDDFIFTSNAERVRQ